MPLSTPPPAEQKLDLREKGAPSAGETQATDRRLYMQLQAFGGCADPAALRKALESRGVEGVLYLDLHDPQGVSILFISEEPEWFVREGREILAGDPFNRLQRKPELAMFGRTYATGREQDVEDWLLAKPRRAALNPAWPWAVWYPLRRKAEFALLSKEEQGTILAEHAKLGIAYGQSGYATDIRLSCYGLDTNDNEFVLGLIGPALQPLSSLIQDMRRTQQTARFIQSMGPFFIGRACWQSPLRPLDSPAFGGVARDVAPQKSRGRPERAKRVEGPWSSGQDREAPHG